MCESLTHTLIDHIRAFCVLETLSLSLTGIYLHIQAQLIRMLFTLKHPTTVTTTGVTSGLGGPDQDHAKVNN